MRTQQTRRRASRGQPEPSPEDPPPARPGGRAAADGVTRLLALIDDTLRSA